MPITNPFPSMIISISSAAGGATLGTANTAYSSAFPIYAGSNITLSQNSNSPAITIIGPAPGGAGGFTLNGTSSSVSISAGAGIAVGNGASTITLSYSGTSNFTGISWSGNTASSTAFTGNSIIFSAAGALSMSGSTNASGGTITLSSPVATNFSLNGSSSSITLLAAGGITTAQNASTITISYSGTSHFTGISLSGNTASSTAFTGNSLIFSAVGAISFTGSTNASGGTITMSSPVATNFSLNGSSSSVTLLAVGGITTAQNASTITISYSGTSNFTGLSWSGNTASSTSFTGNSLLWSAAGILSMTGSTNASGGTITLSVPAPTNFVSSLNGSSGAMSLIAGAGIAFASNASTITISTTGSAVSDFGISSITAGGATSGTTTIASGPILLAAGSNITLSSSAGGITIIGPTPSAAAISVSATSVAGGSITGGANAQFTTLQLIAGSNVGISQNGQSLTISASGGGAAGYTFSSTNNIPLNQVGLLTSTTGTITGSLGFGSSLFLHRVHIDGTINITEADLALGLAFSGTSGAGTLSRSFAVFSIVGGTALSTVMSTSGSSTWQNGTSTTAGATSISQFQGGWQGANIVPMTFASTSLGPGDYVVGNLFNFAQGNSSWTLSVYGPNVGAVGTQQIVSNIASTTAAGLSNAGTGAFAGISNAGTALVSFVSSAASLAITNVEATHVFTSANNTTILGSGLTGLARTIVTAFTSASGTHFTVAPTAMNITAFSVAPTSLTVLSSINPSSLTISNVSTTTLGGFGYIGTGSTTGSYTPSGFFAGIMSTGAMPTSIALSTTALTYGGSTAFIQPWWAVLGA